MGDVVGIDGARLDPLETGLQQSFRDYGQAWVVVNSLHGTAEQWRAAARRVARQLGRPVRTFEDDGMLFAGLTDWPRDERETAIQRRAMRRIVESGSTSTSERAAIDLDPER